MSAIITISGLGKAFRRYDGEWKRIANWFGFKLSPVDETYVLRDVSFTLSSGEAVGIVGQNGAGKSTLLKLITGTLRPTKGNVNVNGRISAILELGMGFNSELTGRENVVQSGALMGYSQAKILEVMTEIEDFADIGDYFDQPLRTYSSGMQVRVAFALATAIRPDLLIIDEALSVGDAYFQAKCYERIANYKKQGMGLLLVTHSVDQVAKHCDRALFLKNGQLVMDGAPAEVTNLYLSDLFGKRKTADEAGVSLVQSIQDGRDDVFETRYGYRKEEHRWGQGGAKILDFLIVADGQQYPHRLVSDMQADFYFKVHFEEYFNSVVPGFLIKTLDGIFLYGTNSFLVSEGQEIISVSSGDILVFKFTLPMALNTGNYLISFGVSSGDANDELAPLERRYDSVIIDVERPVNFWGIMNLGASFEVVERVSIEQNR